MPLLVFLIFTFPILCHAQARLIGIVNTISPASPERDQEVDFILRKKGIVIAIDVKSNAEKNTKGLNSFKERFNPKAAFIVGDGGISPTDFLTMDIMRLFN